jgi:hypothetical protein
MISCEFFDIIPIAFFSYVGAAESKHAAALGGLYKSCESHVNDSAPHLPYLFLLLDVCIYGFLTKPLVVAPVGAAPKAGAPNAAGAPKAVCWPPKGAAPNP